MVPGRKSCTSHSWMEWPGLWEIRPLQRDYNTLWMCRAGQLLLRWLLPDTLMSPEAHKCTRTISQPANVFGVWVCLEFLFTLFSDIIYTWTVTEKTKYNLHILIIKKYKWLFIILNHSSTKYQTTWYLENNSEYIQYFILSQEFTTIVMFIKLI